jgi:hypothetical protein
MPRPPRHHSPQSKSGCSSWKRPRDPFNIAAAALSAGLSQADNQTPKYGEGDAAYAKRFGAAFGDFTSQNLFSDAILACA